MQKSPEPTVPTDTAVFPVIGIAAANSGDSLQRLVRAIPGEAGMAYIILMQKNSLLPELEADCSLPLVQPEQKTELLPDHIYVVPYGKTLTVTDGVLSLTTDAGAASHSHPTDRFFATLGTAFQNYAIAIVLGGNMHGMHGLRAVKAYGGMTIAVESDVLQTGVPVEASRSGLIDFMVVPEAVPQKLTDIYRTFRAFDPDATDPAQQAQGDDEILRQILTLLRLKKQVDFTYYKQTTIKRRIVRRMALNKLNDAGAYLAFLRTNKQEQDLLYADMLISVTSFFRDPKSFDLLCSKVMPDIIRHKAANDALRIWVAGCATGEEAYSISICLSGYLQEHAPGLKLQIFATDISEKAIAKARQGLYERSDLDGLNPEQIEKFFFKTDGRYQVIKEIREHCVFAHHNLLKDPPFAHMDLISCRNVLIYMDPVLQKKAFQTFHYALNEQGVLMLGKSETPGMHAAALFNRINNQEKIYSRKGGASRRTHMPLPQREAASIPHHKHDQQGKDMADFQKSADDLVLARFAPAGVIVNEQLDIVQFRGATGNWLEPSPGKASFNLLRMAREGLSFELRNILHKVKQSGEHVRKEHITMISNGAQSEVTIEAMPLLGDAEPYYLVLFHASGNVANARTAISEIDGSIAPSDLKQLRDRRIEQLEKELSTAREDMRSITEEQEAANEELQSANEELLSSSEELRSLNEELETSQEELQSTNEELSMLNHELIDRNEQLNNARLYAEAILSTVRDPVIILDKDLKVRSATKGFYQKFATKEEDTEGHYFFELKSCPWNSPDLVKKIEQVLLSKSSFLDFELDCDFPALGDRNVLLSARYLDRVNGEQLIIISIEDVTLIRKEKNELRASNRMLEERIKLAVEATGMGTWDFDPVTETMQFDDQCRRLFGFPLHEPISYESFRDAILPEDRPKREHALREALSGHHKGTYEVVYRIAVDGKSHWIKSKGRVFFTTNGQPYRLVGTMLDITKERLNELLLRESEERFRLAADAAAAMIWMSGTDKQANYFNKSWLRFTGNTMEDEVAGGWSARIHPDDLDQCLALYNEQFDARQEFYMEFRMKRQDGQYRWISDAGAPRFSPDGHFEGYIGVCVDIQDQKMTTDELEKQVARRTQSLRNAVHELETSNQNLEEFAYVASHDLQEPLRKIQTFASFIERIGQEQMGDDMKLYLSKIKDASSRMGQLIDDILAYSRLKNTEGTLVSTDLNEIIRQVMADFELKISEKKADITYSGLPVLQAVPSRMHQLFQNLLSNALKFSSPDRAPEISLTGRELTEEEVAQYPTLNKELRYAQITVRDNGIGFDQEFAERIFVIFQRLNGRSEYEGTGIGLAICRKIVINHHGLIFANSVRGVGTSFELILPLAQ